MKSLKLTLTGVPVLYDDVTETLRAAGRNRQERRANAARLRRMVMPIKMRTLREALLVGQRLPPGEHK